MTTNRPWWQSRRALNFAGFAVCAGLMAFALYSEHVMGLNPCPLCIFQRMAVIALGLVFLIAALHNPGRIGARLYSVPMVLAAGTGAGIAGRHVYLQSLPPELVPECSGAPLEFLMNAFPLWEALSMVFTASGECAEVDWSFLGLSMAGWVLLWCVLLGVFAVWNQWRNPLRTADDAAGSAQDRARAPSVS